MRVREIYDALMRMGYPYTKGFEVFKGSMTPTLDRQPRFAKIARGLYQLSSWPTPQLSLDGSNGHAGR